MPTEQKFFGSFFQKRTKENKDFFLKKEAKTFASLVWLARAGLDLLLPPHCPACDAEVAVQGTFCLSCFRRLTFITEPLCHGCGLPFASRDAAGPAHTCATCRDHPPLWREARAALLYDDAAKRLILPFKHADRQDMAEVLAAHMIRAGGTLLAQADIVVPVPLHRWRLFRRGFNQAALLSLAIARRTPCRAVPDALRRVRRTPVLGPLSATQRAEALAGAFAVRASRRAALAGKHVVLVDDVMTSGATALACTETLLQAGCAGVDVLVAARVPLQSSVVSHQNPNVWTDCLKLPALRSGRRTAGLPSVPPISGSTRSSGCGIRPSTRRFWL